MKNSSLRSSERSTPIDAQSKRPARRPSGINPKTPQWLLDSNLLARVCNVLTANGVTDEVALRQMLAVPGGEVVFFKMVNMGKKSVWALREWASSTRADGLFITVPSPACEPEEIVLIYSDEWKKYWRPDGCGYTNDVSEAGRYTFADAVRRCGHVGREKKIRILRVVGGGAP